MLLEYYEEKVTAEQANSIWSQQKLIQFDSFLEGFGFPFPRYFANQQKYRFLY